MGGGGGGPLAAVPQPPPTPVSTSLDDELLAITKIKTFLAKSLSKLHEPAPSSAIP